jgi:hypothetical protein
VKREKKREPRKKKPYTEKNVKRSKETEAYEERNVRRGLEFDTREEGEERNMKASTNGT